MAVDVLYVAWNRLKMTEASFESVLANTDWDEVEKLYVHDDASTDGTLEYLAVACERCPAEVVFETRQRRSPVEAMNWYLDQGTAELFAKVDNDFVMPPGWLADLLAVMDRAPELDILGTEPFVGLDTESESGYTPCEHIGGKGLMRRAAFGVERMHAEGRLGFTSWQVKHPDVTKGWVTPDLLTFGLDQLPFEPWRSQTDEYVAHGWQRRWPEYSESQSEYWSWWLRVLEQTEAR